MPPKGERLTLRGMDASSGSGELDVSTIALVRSAQAGDRAALESLFARYLPRVRQIVAFRLGRRPRDLSDHEDLVQDALLKAFANLEKYEERSEASFRNWIATCVTNTIRDHFRRSGAKKRGEDRVRVIGQWESEDAATVVLPDDGPTPSAIVSRRELVEKVEDALVEMREHWREVILLRLFCEMSFREIGDTLGIAEEATVRKLFSRAMNDLRGRVG